MNYKIACVILVLLLSLSIAGCSSHNNSLTPDNSSISSNNIASTTSVPTNSSANINNVPPANTAMNAKPQIQSESKVRTISAEKILSILSTKSKDVVDSLGISDSDRIKKSIDNQTAYILAFQCKELGILIGFGEHSNFSINTVKELNQNPEYIILDFDTVISFDNNLSFRVGDDFEDIKHKLGEGIWGNLFKAGSTQQLKSSTLTYDINGLSVRFTSREGDDFKKYEVFITKLHLSPIVNPAMNNINSEEQKKLALEAYKAILQNKSNFIQSFNKKSVNLEMYLHESIKDLTLKVTQFAVIDLDKDKIPEIYLGITWGERTSTELYEILRYMNGSVYSYQHGNKGFNGLKADGTFHYSSGVSYDGYAQRRFNQDTTDFSIFAYRESNQYNDEFINSYFVNNKRVSEESYSSYAKKQDEKSDVVWHEFTQKNVEKELSN